MSSRQSVVSSALWIIKIKDLWQEDEGHLVHKAHACHPLSVISYALCYHAPRHKLQYSVSRMLRCTLCMSCTGSA